MFRTGLKTGDFLRSETTLAVRELASLYLLSPSITAKISDKKMGCEVIAKH